MFNVQFHPICTWNFPQFPQPGAFFSRSWHSALYNMPMPSTHGTVNGLDLIQSLCMSNTSGFQTLGSEGGIGTRAAWVHLVDGREDGDGGNNCDHHLQQYWNHVFIYISRALQVCDSSNVCLLHFSVNVGVFTATIPILWSCFSKPLHKQSAAPGCCSLQCSQPQASKSPEYAATCWNMCHGHGRRRPHDVMTIPRL